MLACENVNFCFPLISTSRGHRVTPQRHNTATYKKAPRKPYNWTYARRDTLNSAFNVAKFLSRGKFMLIIGGFFHNPGSIRLIFYICPLWVKL